MNVELRTIVALRSVAGRRPANEDAAVAERLPDGRELIAATSRPRMRAMKYLAPASGGMTCSSSQPKSPP